MKFYTSDLHLGHNNVIEFENRPFKNLDEMDKSIIQNWNNKVNKGDSVYILGDLSFYKGEKTNEILRRLNGNKYLITGNHDSVFLKDKSFDTSLFVWVKDYEEVKDNDRRVILFHYPIAVWNSSHHGSYHLYGHIHSNNGTMHPLTFDLGNKAFNVGVDVNDFKPKTLDELIEMKRIKDYEL